MRAYNTQWIRNRAIRSQAERWQRQQLLTGEQLHATERAFPVEFRETSGYLDIGLFLFTTLAIVAGYALPLSTFMVFFESRTTFGIFNLLAAGVLAVLGQIIIRRHHLYRNGTDNAIAVLLAGFLGLGIGAFLPETLTVTQYCLIALPVLTLVAWYFGDTLVSFLALITFYVLIFSHLIDFSWGKAVLPFVLMVMSLGIYLTIREIFRRNPNMTYYVDPLQTIQLTALVVLAASGNYYVVRELNGLLNYQPGRAETPEISLAWLFWALTFGIPLLYGWLGVKSRSRMLLVLGLAGLFAAFATVHRYHALVSLEAALTIGGGIMILVAVLLIRYLQQPRNGFTDAPDDDSPGELLMQATSLATIHATGTAQQTPGNETRFGGGSFGGGGSEGNY